MTTTMKVTFNINGKAVEIEGTAQEIGAAFDESIRTNDEWYELAKHYLAALLKERVNLHRGHQMLRKFVKRNNKLS